MTTRQTESVLRRVCAVVLATAVLCGLAGCSQDSERPGAEGGPATGSSGPERATPACRSPQSPGSGAWLGVSLDDDDTLAAYAERVGVVPAYVRATLRVPWGTSGRERLERQARVARRAGAGLLLSVEPVAGLSGVSPGNATDIASLIEDATDRPEERRDVPVLLDFAPSMNGSWHAWGQQPSAYVAAFRAVAEAVHRDTEGIAMLWAPVYGGGYPFPGMLLPPEPGSAQFAVLDTDGDGRLTQRDDPYAPYWPGRDAVDWVGLTVRHWGLAFPWGENEPAPAGALEAMLRGQASAGFGAQELTVPDFYEEYAARWRLPLALTGTGAFHTGSVAGAGDLEVQRSWWRQVWDPRLLDRLPALELVEWLEREDVESTVGVRVDWRVTTRPALRRGFRAALPAWLRGAGDRSCSAQTSPK